MKKMDELKPLPRSFYSRMTLTVARDLLGKLLVRKLPDVILTGRIVEVEAYMGSNDPASHAYRRKSLRNAVMFGKAGVAYVYFIYGNHYCLNVVTEKESVPGAILLRALEPEMGLQVMMNNRGVEDSLNTLNGPGKLTEAMKVHRKHNGLDLTINEELYIANPEKMDFVSIATTPRIGVKKGSERPLRFVIKGSSFLSRRM